MLACAHPRRLFLRPTAAQQKQDRGQQDDTTGYSCSQESGKHLGADGFEKLPDQPRQGHCPEGRTDKKETGNPTGHVQMFAGQGDRTGKKSGQGETIGQGGDPDRGNGVRPQQQYHYAQQSPRHKPVPGDPVAHVPA